MAQRYVVPSIYQDISNQSQGYFAFRFVCQECQWAVDTRPIRSAVLPAAAWDHRENFVRIVAPNYPCPISSVHNVRHPWRTTRISAPNVAPSYKQ